MKNNAERCKFEVSPWSKKQIPHFVRDHKFVHGFVTDNDLTNAERIKRECGDNSDALERSRRRWKARC